MSEPTIWDEIMRSPLDPDPDEDRGHLTMLVPIALAAVIGVASGFVIGSNGEPPPTTAALVTTTTAPPPEPDPVLPDGYVAADGVGLKAVAVYATDEDLYVVVNTATRSDLDREETNEFHIAEWVLAGDGIEMSARRALQSRFTPGVRVVHFEGINSLPASAPELQVRRATEMTVRSGCSGCGAVSVDMAEGEMVLDSLELPLTIEAPLLIPVGTGITLSIDALQIAEEWGHLEWHVIDDNDARLRPTITIEFAGTDDPGTDDVDPTQLIPPRLIGPNPQNPISANPDPFSRHGVSRLDRVGEILTVDNQPEQIVLRWSVEWQHPVGDAITIPLDGLTDLGSLSRFSSNS
jgi:hypothetical protein